MSNYIIRRIRLEETYILEDFLYEAIFQTDNSKALPRDVIKEPDISVYINGFGQPDDLCLLATYNDKIIGAVWTRILAGKIKGYGNIDASTPEFAISILKEHRNKGLGTKLMQNMLKLLKESGYEKTSLSVAKNNYAFEMYKKVGFEILEENEDDYIMVCDLGNI